MKISNKKVLILLLSIILTLGMMFILIPEVKATTEYDVWVNGQRFTDENTTIVCGEGTAFYNAETDTLTLDNATIETQYEYKPYYEALIYSERPNLTIKVNGENNLSTSSQYADGIDAGAGCNVNFTGYGTLNITNTYYGMYIGDWSTPGGNIVINGILLNVSETSAAGLWANKDITFSDCSAHITRTSSSYNGIVSNINGTITVDNSYVIVNNGMAGIHFGNGDNSNHALVVNSGELKVNVTGDDAYAIKFEPELGTENINGSITINGGKLDVTSSKGGTNLNQESIILGSNMIYKTGTSLINSGNIVIDKSDLLFPDVPNGKWFTEGIKYVKEKGIMGGYTSGPNAGNFGLNDTITRGQIATMLYRLAGQPDTTGLENPFVDVPAGKYYTEPVKWALSKAITTGKTSTTFDPDGPVTRQELAVFMARYSKEISGNDITSTYNITGMADYNNLSTWARAPMQYIMEKGVITGDMALGYPRILPRANATRATAATMFMRFCQNVLEMH